MKISEAIKWIDNRMCLGRGQWTEHHQPIIDEPWQAGCMAIEALQNSQWIPCSERPPEEEDMYLVTVKKYAFDSSYYDVQIAYFSSNKKWFHISNCEIVAWMPRPKPWKGTDDE